MTILEINSAMINVIDHPTMPMYRKIESIWSLVGKLAPEPKVKEQAPDLTGHKIHRVGRQKLVYTPEQKLATREILRKLGMI